MMLPRIFLGGGKGVFYPLEVICPLELGLNNELSLGQHLYSTVSCSSIAPLFDNLDLLPLNLFSRKVTVLLFVINDQPTLQVYVTGPTKIDHVSANYTKLYFR